MNTLWYCSCLVGGWLLTSCSGPLEEAPYRAYVQDTRHGLTQTQAVGPMTVTCSYRPPDLLVSQELAGNEAVSLRVVDSLRRSHAGRAYFSLSLTQNGAEVENQFITDQAAYTNALAYLNTGIAQDVLLVTATHDSVPALGSAYPRQYGATGRSTVLLVFDTRHLALNQDFQLVFRGNRFQLGTLRFPFAAADLAELPELKF